MEKIMKKTFLTFVLLSASAVSLPGIYELAPSKPVMLPPYGKGTITEMNQVSGEITVIIEYKSGAVKEQNITLPMGGKEGVYKDMRDKNGKMIQKLVEETYTPKTMTLRIGNVVIPIFEWKDNKKK